MPPRYFGAEAKKMGRDELYPYMMRKTRLLNSNDQVLIMCHQYPGLW